MCYRNSWTQLDALATQGQPDVAEMMWNRTDMGTADGARLDLYRRLATGELDAVVALALPGQTQTDLEAVHVERRQCHVAFPPSHPLAARSTITYADLSGHPLTISPGRQDAEILGTVTAELVRRGIELIAAPEADRRAIEQFANVRGLPYLRWYPSRRERHERSGCVVLPIDDNVVFTDLIVYFSKDGGRAVARHFADSVRDYVALGLNEATA
jgi:DNA-binding transcriptional LysR family regulator